MDRKLKRKVAAGLVKVAIVVSGDAEITAKAALCRALGHPVAIRQICCEHCEHHSLCSQLFWLSQLKATWGASGSDRAEIARAIKTCFGEDSAAVIVWLNQP
jgi:hypothetical protein